MGKKIILKTSASQIDEFVQRQKTIVIDQKFAQRPKDKRYFEIKCDLLDEDGFTIPHWSFKICVKPISNDDCQDTYGIYHQLHGNNESVLRLDVHHKEKVGHKENGIEFFGAHLHELNTTTSCIEDFEFDCMNCENRSDWLEYFAQLFNINIEYKLDDTTDLFGGWECSA